MNSLFFNVCFIPCPLQVIENLGKTACNNGDSNFSGDSPMPAAKKPTTKTAKANKVHKVMDEYKHGALKSGKGGKGGKVKSRKQAIAIAMNESGQSYKNKKAPVKKATAKKTAKKKTMTAKKSAGKKSGDSRVD
jgi:hypothetical protein